MRRAPPFVVLLTPDAVPPLWQAAIYEPGTFREMALLTGSWADVRRLLGWLAEARIALRRCGGG